MVPMSDDAQSDWGALVDIIARGIESFRKELHFTCVAHAHIIASEIEREWLAEHDRQVAERAWDEGDTYGMWTDNPYRRIER